MQVVADTQLTILFWAFELSYLVILIESLVCSKRERAIKLNGQEIRGQFDKRGRFQRAVKQLFLEGWIIQLFDFNAKVDQIRDFVYELAPLMIVFLYLYLEFPKTQKLRKVDSFWWVQCLITVNEDKLVALRETEIFNGCGEIYVLECNHLLVELHLLRPNL